MGSTRNSGKLSLWSAIFIAVTAIQMIVFVFCFTQKTAHHEDEYFHYALANSYYRPYLYGSGYGIYDNYNSWETGDSFRYYLRVNKDTAFRYDSVWYNQATDTNPPLHYAVLHTISSLFPDRFSWWWGNSLNLITFLLTQIFLYKWIKELCRSEFPALLACIFYGFSTACLNTTMFVRMYSMLTMCAVMFTYLSHRILMKERVKVSRDLLPIALVTLMGALTHHLFLIYAFAHTFLQCIYYLGRKRFRNMFGYGLAALAGVAVYAAVFPAAFEHLLVRQSGGIGKPDLEIQLHLLGILALFETTGIEGSLYRDPAVYYVIAVLVTVAVLSVPILYLFREKLMIRERLTAAVRKLPLLDYGLPIAGISTAAYFVFIAASVDYFRFGQYIDRYIFLIFPLMIGVIIGIVYKLISPIKHKAAKKIVCCVFSAFLAGILGFQIFASDRTQYIKQDDPDNGSISSYVEGKDCILLLKQPINLPCYSLMLDSADDIFISRTSNGYYDTQDENYRRLFDANDEVYLLIDEWQLSAALDQGNITVYSDEKHEEAEASDDSDDDVSLSATEMLVKYFEDGYGVKGEYCTSAKAPFEGFKVCLYRLTKQS